MQINKDNITIIKLLCGLIPKTAPSHMSTMIFFYNENNQVVIYGGDISVVKFKYYIIYNYIFSQPIALVAYTLLSAIKNTKKNIECDVINGNFVWIENSDTTSLKTITTTYINDNIEYKNPISILMADLIYAIKSINIKVDNITSKCYMHITNEFIRFIIIDSGRLSVSAIIKCNTIYNIFVMCNYESLNTIINLLLEEKIDLYIQNNILIIKQSNLELYIGITKANYINYNKYTNQIATSTLVVNTSLLYNALKSLVCINKNQTEIVSLLYKENILLLECYNPNIGSKKVQIPIIQGTLNRILKFSLLWLTEALKTISVENCNLIYGDLITHPLIIYNDNIHVIAPIVTA